MKVEIKATISMDIEDVRPPDFWNSDTKEDYIDELKCAIDNKACEMLSSYIKNFEEICIVHTEPYDDGWDEYYNIIDEYETHFKVHGRGDASESVR